MERILIVMDAEKPAMHVVNFACKLASVMRWGLTAVLVDNIYKDNQPLATDIHGTHSFEAEVKPMVVADTEQTVRLIRDRCKKDHISVEISVTGGEPITEVLFNSKFADLLVLDPALDFYGNGDSIPSHFAAEILRFSECPVLLAPLQEAGINEIDFCYNGSASSVFAIKQFTYLFPAFCDKNVFLIEVKETAQKLERTERRMMEWLRVHYNEAEYVQLQGDPGNALFDYFFMKTNRLIVLGSYGRNLLSQLFKQSTAEKLIRMIDLPIFITHH